VSRGVFSRRIVELVVGVVVGVVFGGALLSGLVPHSGISWQDHLFGAVGGLLAARRFGVPRGSQGAKPAPVARS